MRLFTLRPWRRVIDDLAPGPLRDYLLAPRPDLSAGLDAGRLLAVDIETTGLNPARDQILSIGFVPVDGLQVNLSGAGRVLVRPSIGVGDSATVHGLTDDALAGACDLAEALDLLFTALNGRLLLAHHAGIEARFLGRACEQVHGVRPRFSVVDTLQLQFGLLSQGFDDEPPPGSLRLWTARDQYGLPRYAAHDAFTDALACAELYLAEAAELQAFRPRRLSDVVRT